MSKAFINVFSLPPFNNLLSVIDVDRADIILNISYILVVAFHASPS